MQTDIENVRWLQLDRYNGHGLHEPVAVSRRRLAGMFVLSLTLAALLWLAVVAAVLAWT
jgi:hypothetical protein